MSARWRTLPEALTDAAASGTGYLFVDGASERPCSYAELLAAADRFARALAAVGTARGELVALILTDPAQFLVALMGASLAGVVPASLHPPTATSDLDEYVALAARVLQFARPRAVIADAALGDDIAARSPAVAGWADVPVWSFEELAGRAGPSPGGVLEPEPGSDRRRWPSLEDLALVQFTSGSTSEPKGVAVTHRSLAANIEAINGPSGLATGEADAAVSWLPLHHDMGLVGMALGPLYAARPAVLMTPSTFVKRPAAWLRAISRRRATVSFAPNFAYELALRRIKPSEVEGVDLSCWRVAGLGGEPIHAPTLEAFAERFRPFGFRAASFLPCYGLAEHVLAATFPPRGRPIRTATLDGAEFVGCGFPLPGHQLRIVDERGVPVTADRVAGEIVLAGPSVMQGYYGADALTADAIRGGWLHTGDLGFLDDGELFVCGRIKDVIVVNGRKYHPQDLEWAVSGVAGVRRGRAVAFGVSQAGAADRVVVVVEPAGGAAVEELAREIRRRVGRASGLYVDEVVVAPPGAIGRTTSGKLQRLAAKRAYEQGLLGPAA